MAELGEIRRGVEIGKKYNGRFIWSACPVCGKTRWVTFVNGEAKWKRCLACANHTKLEERHASLRGEKNPNWHGGRRLSSDGYILVKLQSDDPFYSMARKDGYVLEHRLVVAKALGRCLLPQEIVHHEGVRYSLGTIENKRDNLIDNLEPVASQGEHNTMVDKRIKYLEDMVDKQATQIKLLQWRIGQLEMAEIKTGGKI